MSDILNVVLIHSNYFKNILITDNYQLIINLSLLNKNYYKLINNVYKNYIVHEFPHLNLLNIKVKKFRCKSWIHVYRFIFRSPIIKLYKENSEFKIDINEFLFPSVKTQLSGYNIGLMLRRASSQLSNYDIKVIRIINTFYIIPSVFKKDGNYFPHTCKTNKIKSIEHCPRCDFSKYNYPIVKYDYSREGYVGCGFQIPYETPFDWEKVNFYSSEFSTQIPTEKQSEDTSDCF